MKILKVIHGYPPLYSAGSEVYSQNLCHGLAEKHEVHIFTREENTFEPDFSMRQVPDTLNSRIQRHLINIPLMRQRYKYSHPQVDQKFGDLLDELRPEIVHFGHLNHLSTTLVDVVKQRNIPTIYTLHDFWLMCARGQFLQRNHRDGDKLLKLCSGQDNKKCAQQCYSGYFSGLESRETDDIAYWTGWFAARMSHIREIVNKVDLFIAPAHHLLERYRTFFKLPDEKLIYLDYGFNHKRLQNRQRQAEDSFVFGYIGTHTPQKGIHHLLEAFGKTTTPSKLKIWGHQNGEITKSLHSITQHITPEKQNVISWEGPYRNENIVEDVFNHVDAIVVPSLWEENSPLVIHEAQQVRIPVITADVGGMAEYVHHNVNGLLFKHRDIEDLTSQMDTLAQDPTRAQSLGEKGYLYTENGDIPEISQHVYEIEKHYHELISNNSRGEYAEQTRAMAHHV
jgi:glycosyltransferase involved in cell wall biosynthesis